MIRSVAVVHRAIVEAAPGAAAEALVTIATPGGAIVAPPGERTLHLSFDTLAGELETASLCLPRAAPAVPFRIDHAHALAAFLSALQREREPIGLRVCESEGYVRSVTVARWAARRLGCPLCETEQAAAIASCVLMDSVLNRVPHPAREVPHRAPQDAGCVVQP